MNKRNNKFLVLGILIGLLSSISIQVFANTNDIVQAYLRNDIKFKFDGNEEKLDEGYAVLNYDSRTYVPARFIAEKLRAEVNWVEETSTIEINSSRLLNGESQEEKNSEIEDDINDIYEEENMQDVNKEETKIYSGVPVSKDLHDKLISVTDISYDNGHWRVYLKVENKGDTPIQLLQRETKVVVDDKNYTTKYLPIHLLDNKWYNDIKKRDKDSDDDVMKGFITLPEIHKNPEKFDLTFYILQNDGKQEKQEIKFNVKIKSE